MAPTDASTRPRVVLACPGLDHARRGFESFARECFDALRDDPGIELELVKASGSSGPHERVLHTPTRASALVKAAARVWGRPAFVVEHLAFCVALAPYLMVRRPTTVYFSEWHVGLALARWRRLTRQRLRLVFCNGAFAAGPYEHLDCVQQLTPGALEYVTARGVSPERQLVLPLGVNMPAQVPRLSSDERVALRRRLALPEQAQILISVAALNTEHKRIDYLIDEVARLPEPRPFLLLVGEPEREAQQLGQLARDRLGISAHTIRSVPMHELPDLYRASDVFVLSSLWEAFGRVLVEALAYGLPCVAHRHPVMEWVLGGEGQLADLRQVGALASAIASLNASAFGIEARQRRHSSVQRRFSWPALGPSYVGLLRGDRAFAGG